jgi:hypothetical protein
MFTRDPQLYAIATAFEQSGAGSHFSGIMLQAVPGAPFSDRAMRTIAALLAGAVGAAVGWACGYVACTALYLWLPPELAAPLAAETGAIKLFGAAFALAGAAAGLRLALRPATVAGAAVARNAATTFVAAGCAFFGSIVGMGAFLLAYALLKPFELEPALERNNVFLLFATVFGLIAFAGGFWFARRRPPGEAAILSRSSLRELMLAALAGIGAGWIGNYVGYSLGIWIANLFALTGADFKDAVVLSIPVTTLVLGAAGILMTVRYHAGHRAFAASAVRGAIALAVIVLVVPGALGLSRRLDTAYETIARAPTIFFNLRLPAHVPAPASKDGITIELQTEHGRQPGRLFDREWIDREDDHPVLKGFFDHKEPARQRLVVLSLPGEPKRVFDLRLARIPTSERSYGPWQKVDFIEDGGTRRDAGAADDFAIRFHAWRP